MTEKQVNTLYPTNFKKETELREFIKHVLLNSDFPSYKNNVKYLLNQSVLPKDITGIISEFVFCNKNQWNDTMEECVKMYKNDIQDFDSFLENLEFGHNKILSYLEFERQLYVNKKMGYKNHKNYVEFIKPFTNIINFKHNKRNYKRYNKIITSNRDFFSTCQNIIDKLNMYIHILQIDILDISYQTYLIQRENFNMNLKINYAKGIDIEILFFYLRNKVSNNCKKISPNFKLNLEDISTRITGNFNVHSRIDNKNIDGLLPFHTGALLGYFFQKLISTIRIGMLKKIKYDILGMNLSIPQRYR